LSIYNHFQWYYFDLHNTDGYDLICTFHHVPFNSVFHISIIDVYLYKDEKTELHHYFVLPQKNVTAEMEPFKLQFDANNFIIKEKNKIIVQAEDKRIRLRLDLSDRSRGTIHRASLLPREYPNDGFYWKVFAPWCDGRASLHFDDRDIQLKGMAYHDFNGGSLNLKKVLKYWYWGKYAFDGRLFIFGEITTRKHETRNIALLAEEGSVQMDENPARTVKDGVEFYSTQMGEFSFRMGKRRRIDTINFFMSSLNSIFITKLLEVIFQLSTRLPGFAKLHRYMENTRYLRYRCTGTSGDGHPVNTFYEEMFL